MPDMTATQQAVAQARSRQAVALLLIDLPTPLYYTTWHSPLQWPVASGPVYLPKSIDAPAIPMTDPLNARWYVVVEDTDQTLISDLYANRASWNGIDVTFTILSRVSPNDAWTSLYSVTWTRTNSEYDPNIGWMKINLNAAGGLRPRAGLSVGSHESCPNAPDPKNPISISLGTKYMVFPTGNSYNPPPPGGENPPYYGVRQDNPDTTTLYYDDDLNEAMAEANIGSTMT